MKKRETFAERNARHNAQMRAEIIQYWPLAVIIILFLIGCRI